ncbi:MAG TPA: beta-galactosidase GalA [Lacunisphaera sp.]|jgi:beta-galactosidase
MKLTTASRLLLLLIASALGATVAHPTDLSEPRERLRMDTGWRFSLGHPYDTPKDFDHATGYFSYLAKAGFGDGPAGAKFDDAAWRKVDLPHDWAIELPFSAKGSASHGYKAIGRNFPENSVGWYRKSFFVPASDLGRRIGVEFDGVYRDSVVWVNGFYLGREPSGYTGFHYDLTDYLNYGGENVISVRVDATMEEGWFYEGAGIYRHAWLTKTSPLHVATWGTYVTTENVEDRHAEVIARTMVMNDGTSAATFDVDQEILDETGKSVASGSEGGVTIAAGVSMEVSEKLAVPNPCLWSIETPVLHKLITTIRSGGAIVDRYETPFGIRTIHFDPDHGFFLNGKRVELKGTDNHQDHAGVGVALPDALQEFRIKQLKAMGSNAYRCAHNPPTPELLDACDRLGMLVIDENRLMGSSPEQLRQLGAMIRRDRNHPSVILWSLGNEEWAIEGNILGARIAASMQRFARRLDPTRLDTVAISGGWGGISITIDVAGFNYIKQGNTDKQHAEFPRQIGVGTEETSTQATRGIYFDDRAHAHLSPQLNGSSGGNAESGWKHYAARPYLAGVFFWTGFDYRGEPTPFDWPAVSTQFGILDTCGFTKDCFYYLKAWWGDAPVLHIFPHWNWPGKEGQEITVTADSNDEAVELLLNGQSLGKKEMPINGHLEWKVVYQPGVLEARGFRGGKVMETARVETTGQATRLQLAPDRATIKADGEDVSVISVKVADAQGRIVPTADNNVTFTLEGPGQIIGVGNGDPVSHEPDQFLETVRNFAWENWHGRIASPGTTKPAAPETLEPLAALSNWKAPLPKSGEIYDLSGSITLNAAPIAGVKLGLFLPSLGTKTSVWINGHELARDIDTSQRGVSLPLEPGQLIVGFNHVQILVTPILDQKNHLPELTRFGSLQFQTPAPTWQRKVFNGYAQVIVQSNQQTGAITLTAHGKDLSSATVTINSETVALPPAVP